MNSQLVINQRNKLAELGYSTVCLWYLAEPSLRSTLEQSLRAYLKRQPDFRRAFERAAKEIVPPPESLGRTYYRSCAALLFAIWERGDSSLRTEIQDMVRLYVKDNPESLASFREIIQLHEQHHSMQWRVQ